MLKQLTEKSKYEWSLLKGLKLTVKEPWFSLMQSGEKPFEVREPSDWIKARLYDKNGCNRNYDYIEIKNGYGANRPVFKAKFEGFGTKYNATYKFESKPDLILKVNPEQFVIFLGEIIERKNIK